MLRTKLIYLPLKPTDSNTCKCDGRILRAKEEKNNEKWTHALTASTGNMSPKYYSSRGYITFM